MKLARDLGEVQHSVPAHCKTCGVRGRTSFFTSHRVPGDEERDASEITTHTLRADPDTSSKVYLLITMRGQILDKSGRHDNYHLKKKKTPLLQGLKG